LSQAKLILASRSPRRRELLSQIGVVHSVHSADIEEIHSPVESPEEYCLRLAASKAEHVWGQLRPAVPVLGADTIGVCGDEILEKPNDFADAKRMLRAMSASVHQVISAIAITDGERTETGLSVTDVKFRELSDAEIAAYWHTGEPLDKSGAYAIQGLGAVFVQSITGSYSNVVGLPIESLVPLLIEFNVPVWQSSNNE
jgi:septum formation protein